jgi:hypothetical protein
MILYKGWFKQIGSKRFEYQGWFLFGIIPLYVVRYGMYEG